MADELNRCFVKGLSSKWAVLLFMEEESIHGTAYDSFHDSSRKLLPEKFCGGNKIYSIGPGHT